MGRGYFPWMLVLVGLFVLRVLAQLIQAVHVNGFLMLQFMTSKRKYWWRVSILQKKQPHLIDFLKSTAPKT